MNGIQIQADPTSNMASAVDKVARYRWLSRNEPGELRYVPKGLLQVDRKYQRPLNDKKRLRIAARFNWAAFGVLIVATRSDGSLWIIDGQHRHAAAMDRNDVADVPVVIFHLNDSVIDEATDFLVANKERKPLTGVESFLAMVASNDPPALFVQSLIETSGRHIATGTQRNGVACVRALCKCALMDTAALQRIWPLICVICEEESIDNRLVLGMFHLERRLVDSNGDRCSLADSRNRGKLREAGYSSIMRAIGDAAAYYARGGDTVFARGILNVLNYRRTNRLRLHGDESQ